MPALHVHLGWALEPSPLKRLESLLADTEARDIRLTAGPETPPPSTRILVKGRPSEADLDACPDLETLVIPFAGVPVETRELLLQRPEIAVHNLHHNAAPTAELALALLLAAAKGIVPLDRRLRRGDWTPRYEDPPGRLLSGRHALVLGYGAVGHRIAAGCLGLGLEVTALRRRPHESLSASIGRNRVRVLGPEALPELLTETDALLVALPLTEETEGWIGVEELAALPSQAVLVNVARGPIVEEEALYEALKAKRIAAAGLDVWYRYPKTEQERPSCPPSRFPFEELDNVVMTPHLGGHLAEDRQEDLRMEALARTLRAAAEGQPLPHRVDLEAGY